MKNADIKIMEIKKYDFFYNPLERKLFFMYDKDWRNFVHFTKNGIEVTGMKPELPKYILTKMSDIQNICSLMDKAFSIKNEKVVYENV
jgi:hypothetical protein